MFLVANEERPKVKRMFPKPFCERTMAESREIDREPRSVACLPSRRRSQGGFSLLEVTVVVVIILILAGMTAPKILGMIELQRLQTTARAYASFLQEARYKAEQNSQWCQVLVDLSDPNVAIVYLDVDGDGTREPTEPSVQIPYPITMPDPAGAGIPAGFGNANLLGATPLTVDTTPKTWNCVHAGGCTTPVQVAGLQFNERGLPCQRVSSVAACTNTTQITSASCSPNPVCAAPVAWITYFAYPTSTSGTLYEAVTVTPAGRIKVWSFQGGAGGGTWR